MQVERTFEGQSNVAMFLRTGVRFRHQDGPDIEVKFNPWHDPDDGRFTFAGQGRHFPSGGVAGRAGGMSRRPALARAQGRTRPVDVRPIVDEVERVGKLAARDPRHPSNYVLHRVQRGDSLTRIARQRQGLRVSDLAWLNNLPADSRLRVGQQIKLPHQRSLDAGRDALGVARGLAAYMDRHGGQIPAGQGPIVDQLIAERTQ